jgi:hypothetical protein
MATKAERAREEDERAKGQAKTAKAKKTAAKKAAPARAKGRTAGKATYAYEPPRPGKPSRKSSRKSANRAKPDVGLTATESTKKGSPEARFRKARDGATRVRGSSSHA